MSPTCSTLSRCLQKQRHFWTRLLYLLSRFVVRHRLNCLVLVYIYLYYFTSGKTYFAFQIWRPLKWFRYPCYDVGCYPCLWLIHVFKAQKTTTKNKKKQNFDRTVHSLLHTAHSNVMIILCNMLCGYINYHIAIYQNIAD